MIGGVSLRGGVGRVGNVVLGALFIGLVQNGMNLARIESYLQTVVLGVLLDLGGDRRPAPAAHDGIHARLGGDRRKEDKRGDRNQLRHGRGFWLYLRKLFRSERVDEEEGLGIRQVTFLFTDLKGSTALYERLGDLNAYALVREHFALLDAVAHRHAGAIVKTIGDAVMAAFSRPVDAVAAALRILQEIEQFNREHGQPAIILKMGAHCGPSIAVTLNENLDYFGQTVNIAARVQSFADAGEICLTEALYTASGVRELLAGHDVEEFDAPLRGVEGNARVYRVIGRS